MGITVLQRSFGRMLLKRSTWAVLGVLLVMTGDLARGEQVRMGGTGSGVGVLRSLAESFKTGHPEFAYEVVPSLGSTGGIKAVSRDLIQIGISNRLPRGDEAMPNVRGTRFARTPFIIVTRASGVRNLSISELADIYAGRRTRWNDGSLIRVVLRPESDSDSKALADMSAEMKAATEISRTRKGLPMAVTDQEAADAVERLPGGLSTSSLSLVQTESRPVSVLSINGVEPALHHLRSGKYPYYKDFYLVFKDENPSPMTRKFIDFVLSAQGRALLPRLGSVSIEETAAIQKQPAK